MKMQFLKYWERLSASFWFVPSLMASAAAVAAFVMIGVDEYAANQGKVWGYEGGAEGASVVLGTIAGSMITIAGVVFSMTLVALTLASAQLGPRLLRNFMRNRANQVMLGTFVSTFVYCLLVLRTIRRVDENAFVPHLSVSIGVVFALVSLAVLIYFIHHVSMLIQADEVVARVGNELCQAIEQLFPEHIGNAQAEAAATATAFQAPLDFEGQAAPVLAAGDGYLQLIDAERLLALAVEADVQIRVERQPGQYVVCGRPLVLVWPGERSTEALERKIQAIFVLGNQRTSTQDLGFAIKQLVEIAVRALSPGVNDPFTAVSCVDRLGSALYRLADRNMPEPCRFDAHQQLRVLSTPLTFSDFADAAFNQIRQYGRNSVTVTLRLMETIGVVAEKATRPADREALRHHALLIVRGASEGLPEPSDYQTVRSRYETVLQTLGRGKQ